MIKIIGSLFAGAIVLWFILLPFVWIIGVIGAALSGKKMIVKSSGQILYTKSPELYNEPIETQKSYRYIVRKEK